MLGYLPSTALVAVLSMIPLQVAFAQGTAADLDGLEPVGWPLGVPMSCVQVSAAIDASLKESVVKLREYCNEQNAKMESEGYAACAENMCLDGATTTSNGRDYGSVRLRMGRSQWSGSYYATLLYTFPGIGLGAKGPSMSCFDPADRAEELLRTELETWNFQRFVEFCVKRP
jgi:hypothetical protein